MMMILYIYIYTIYNFVTKVVSPFLVIDDLESRRRGEQV